MSLNIIERQFDGKNQISDKQIISDYNGEKEVNFNLFNNIYCYSIHSEYIPLQWG